MNPRSIRFQSPTTLSGYTHIMMVMTIVQILNLVKMPNIVTAVTVWTVDGVERLSQKNEMNTDCDSRYLM